ncbi:hypothetical protein IPH25_04050 [bacterium]|nr:MAG: hypothetical protein IPG37_01045 [bacterium]QQR61619.1 MAG: hypothetical protein IPH25_04050 [bacterium]QQR62820.1 MAG: hypothetical protein IPH67_05435 [bacterium]
MKQAGAAVSAVGMATASVWLVRIANQCNGDACGGYLLYALIPGFLSAVFADTYIRTDFYKDYKRVMSTALSQEEINHNARINQNISEVAQKGSDVIQKLLKNEAIETFINLENDFKQKKDGFLAALNNQSAN